MSNISAHLNNYKIFVNEVISELNNINTIWEPHARATKNGFQSLSNLFEDPIGKLKTLKSIVLDELDLYYAKHKHEKCSFIQKWPSKKYLSGWHVILKKGGHQSAHIHSEGWLSGVIYLKVVPSLEKNEGGIEFGLNGIDYSDAGSPAVVYQPKLGDIIFFPSSLHHRTIPFTTSMDRIVISFDMVEIK